MTTALFGLDGMAGLSWTSSSTAWRRVHGSVGDRHEANKWLRVPAVPPPPTDIVTCDDMGGPWWATILGRGGGTCAVQLARASSSNLDDLGPVKDRPMSRLHGQSPIVREVTVERVTVGEPQHVNFGWFIRIVV